MRITTKQYFQDVQLVTPVYCVCYSLVSTDNSECVAKNSIVKLDVRIPE